MTLRWGRGEGGRRSREWVVWVWRALRSTMNGLGTGKRSRWSWMSCRVVGASERRRGRDLVFFKRRRLASAQPTAPPTAIMSYLDKSDFEKQRDKLIGEIAEVRPISSPSRVYSPRPRPSEPRSLRHQRQPAQQEHRDGHGGRDRLRAGSGSVETVRDGHGQCTRCCRACFPYCRPPVNSS
jgi:hypothetical protein